jgi:hypothetical protein
VETDEEEWDEEFDEECAWDEEEGCFDFCDKNFQFDFLLTAIL